MPATETSVESYKAITDLGEQQLKVYNALKEIEPASDRDIEIATGMKMGAINGRRGELVRFGYVVEHGRKYDRETDSNVITWVTADPMAQRQIQKVIGKTETKKESDPKMKYLLKLKNGQRFTITGAMKDEIEDAIKAKRGGKTITVANTVFVLSNIALPITEFGNAEAAKSEAVKEKFREEIMIIVDGQWRVTDRSDSSLRREKIVFRSRKIGETTGTVKEDLMTIYDGVYESVRDMRGSNE